MKKLMMVGGALAALTLTGCGVTAAGRSVEVPGVSSAVADPAQPSSPLPTSTYDAGGEGQYPATVWHYDGSVQEDDAGRDCDWRGGSMVDDATERFVCVTD